MENERTSECMLILAYIQNSMGFEIERKFLVKGNYKDCSYKSERIMQGYLSSVPERTVRVRLKGDKAYLTIKGINNENGFSRFEWEKEILVEDAKQLMLLCEPGVIDKERFHVKSGVHVFEIDEFFGENQGLVVAEIELSSEEEKFICPDWVGEEVTDDSRYYNSSLSKIPYSKW